jgi:hypothetical protein
MYRLHRTVKSSAIHTVQSFGTHVDTSSVLPRSLSNPTQPISHSSLNVIANHKRSELPTLAKCYYGVSRHRSPVQTVAYAYPNFRQTNLVLIWFQCGEIPKPITYRV